MAKVLRILGTRGVPAGHGGFETFAEHLALHLVARGWQVIVYCQGERSGPVQLDGWQGVRRVHIGVDESGPRGTIVFDWRATLHARRAHAAEPGVCLTLGYNTAVFCALLRSAGIPNLINMDGIEWRRHKWSATAKAWFWLNDWAGCWLGDHLVADHPEIARHLATRVGTRKTTTIVYGADRLSALPETAVRERGLEPGRYLTLVARPEPENSILEVVQGFSRHPRGLPLVVLGHYDSGNAYHRAVQTAASSEVRFLGAIYDKAVVQALRFHSTAYVHGHQVGGTNPSLVEALGAGNAVIAHDNRFNRWVIGEGGRYFRDADSFAAVLDTLLASQSAQSAWPAMRGASRARFEAAFTWDRVLGNYEALLTRYVPAPSRTRST